MPGFRRQPSYAVNVQYSTNSREKPQIRNKQGSERDGEGRRTENYQSGHVRRSSLVPCMCQPRENSHVVPEEPWVRGGVDTKNVVSLSASYLPLTGFLGGQSPETPRIFGLGIKKVP